MSDHEATTLDDFEYESETASLSESGEECMKNAVEEYVKVVVELRSKPVELSETISLIECQNGTKVYLIGTAHFSEESIEEVKKVMQLQKPDIVVLELCKNRTSILSLEKEKVKEDLKRVGLINMLKSHGVGQGILEYVLLRVNAYLISQLDMIPGGEFKAAVEEAYKQPHCHIFLGDRPISITIYRALGALGLWTRLKFIYVLLFNLEPITKEQIEEMKKSDIVEKLLLEVAGDHPELIEVLVHERDRYLTRSIYEASGMPDYIHMQQQQHLETTPTTEQAPDDNTKGIAASDDDNVTAPLLSHRSAAPRSGDHQTVPTSGDSETTGSQLGLSCCPHWPDSSRLPRVVVAVVGFGHLAGIKRLWPMADQIDKTELVKLVEPPLSWKLFKWSLRGLLLSTVVGVSYVALRSFYSLSYAMISRFM